MNAPASNGLTVCRINNMAYNLGVFECVVCGKPLTLKSGINIFVDLTKPQRKRSVCSDNCMRLYDAAIRYVDKTYGIKNAKVAREIVISTWFDRGVKQSEKDIRVQKRNAERNAAA